MPVICTFDAPAKSGAQVRYGGAQPAMFRESDAACLDIGLVNNMPDAALEATERQFLSLLDAAAEDVLVRLTLYSLPDVARTDAGRCRVAGYADAVDLWNGRLDGLIVTGAEPLAADLTDEPYWDSLARTIEWAGHHTHSAIWSCLAAHAAVLHLDGIPRRRLNDKRFGVFECTRASDHPLTGGHTLLRTPHSRWNDLSEEALVASGYRVLTRSNESGADAFVKEAKSLFLFFQGHPEYEADTLLREYRRDIGRFLRGERETYPSMPSGYFNLETARLLAALEERAQVDRREQVLAEFPTAPASSGLTRTWWAASTGIYRNWLHHLRSEKRRRARGQQRVASA
jgi:homoserine O-succinyltransferase/O-acetyltransferase